MGSLELGPRPQKDHSWMEGAGPSPSPYPNRESFPGSARYLYFFPFSTGREEEWLLPLEALTQEPILQEFLADFNRLAIVGLPGHKEVKQCWQSRFDNANTY